MYGMSITHWLIVIGIIIVLFGSSRIKDLMIDLARGIRESRRTLAKIDDTNDRSA